MQTFFHGWRQKVGCVVLGMTCVLALEWLRSYYGVCLIGFPIEGQQHAFISADGEVSWIAWPSTVAGFDFAMSDAPLGLWVDVPYEGGDGIRYWKVVPPLTLLSIYLIIRKPRKQVAS